jgi:7,8-dihydropterin-6-yl-methyl-4-(beta-D-ribofuranosyl)aminobenzene 5'-phosphate synthase
MRRHLCEFARSADGGRWGFVKMKLAGALLGLSLVLVSSQAQAYELINLYDAFGEKREGTQQDFGFSALVRHKGKTILFDSGTNADVLEKNAKALGVDLSKVDFAVASHAHSDHTGGFDYLKRVNPKVKIYFPSDFFGAGGPLDFDVSGKEPDVAEELPAEQRYFAGKHTKAKLRTTGRFYGSTEYVKKSKRIAPGVHLIATTSPNMGYFTSYPGVDLEGKPVVDEGKAKHLGLPELSLSLSTKKGEVLIVGCSHSTVEAIVKETKKVTKRKVHLLAGGYHLLPYDRATIAGIAERLKKKLGVESIAPAHCTGHLAFKVLRDVYAANYRFFGLGSKLEG